MINKPSLWQKTSGLKMKKFTTLCKGSSSSSSTKIQRILPSGKIECDVTTWNKCQIYWTKACFSHTNIQGTAYWKSEKSPINSSNQFTSCLLIQWNPKTLNSSRKMLRNSFKAISWQKSRKSKIWSFNSSKSLSMKKSRNSSLKTTSRSMMWEIMIRKTIKKVMFTVRRLFWENSTKRWASLLNWPIISFWSPKFNFFTTVFCNWLKKYKKFDRHPNPSPSGLSALRSWLESIQRKTSLEAPSNGIPLLKGWRPYSKISSTLRFPKWATNMKRSACMKSSKNISQTKKATAEKIKKETLSNI